MGGILLLWAVAPTAYAQRVLNETLTADSSSQGIEVFADHGATWTEAGKKIYLLRGNVAVTQGGTTIRSPDVVLWIDQARFEKERVYYVLVYGDDPVSVERNQAVVKADFGYLRMATTAKIEVKTFKSGVVPGDVSNDRIYLRALANQPGGSRTALDTPAPKMDPGLRLAGGLEPEAPRLPAPPAPVTDPQALLPRPPEFGKKDDGPKVVMTVYFQVPPEPKLPVDGPLPPPAPPNLGPVAPPSFPVNPPAAPQAAPRKQPQISIRPRYSGDLQVQYKPEADGTTAVIVTGTGGVAVIVQAPATTPAGKTTSLDIEADRIVVWTRGNGQNLFNEMKGPQGADSGAHEIYMSGHVELRTRTAREVETLRCDECYYDVRRGVAVARMADLEIQSAKLSRPMRIWTNELIQVNPKLYKAKEVGIHSSILPSDPGLLLNVNDATVEERQVERSYLGFIPAYDKEGKRIVDTERIFTGWNLVARMEGVPIFYFPYLKDKVEDPLGPLDEIGAGYDRILGFQFRTTWDVYDLLHLPHFDGTRWRLYLDVLGDRGPALGTEFDFAGKDLLGTKAHYSGNVRLYGIWDRGLDVLGGDRGNFAAWPDTKTMWPITHPNFRGHAFGKVNVQDLPEGFTVLGQFAFLSDRNFLEQYYFNTHLNEMNQDTYLYLKQQQHNWAWSLLGQIGTREWMTETDWLPKADGYLVGQTFLDDWFVYNAHASAGYGRLRPAGQVPFAYSPTDVRVDALRLDLFQELSLPFYLGPVKLAPYLKGDAAYYSNDVSGKERGRLFGGGGLRANLPLSRLYQDVESEIFNLNGLYHKINLTGNYFTGYSSSRFTNFPQFDRLNDDVTDQTLRDIRPWQSVLNPASAAFLTSSALFNPQSYAIRRLIDANVDTLDQIDVLQFGIQQRWQTKRGMMANEHVIDWMSLNLGASIFPRSNRDNFGRTFGILEYDWNWNIGDRTALTSSGWFEPFDGGPRAFDFGAILQRPDTSSFYLGYRQIDPLQSKAVVASVVYPFSAKYAVTASTVWDFGVDVRTYSLFLSRMGTDVMVNFGLTYNSTVNTFGIAFEVLPNLARRPGRFAGLFPAPPVNIDPMINQR